MQAISDGDGGFYLAAGTVDVTVIHVDKNGYHTFQPTNWLNLDGDGNEQWLGHMAMAADSTLLITYLDVQLRDFWVGRSVLKIQKIDRSGNLLWGEGIPVDEPPMDQDSWLWKESYIHATKDSGCVVIWHKEELNTHLRSSYVQRFDIEGESKLTENGSLVMDTCETIWGLPQPDNSLLIGKGSKGEFYQFDVHVNQIDTANALIMPGFGHNVNEVGEIFVRDHVTHGWDSLAQCGWDTFFYQKYNPNGEKLWGDDGVVVFDSSNFLINPHSLIVPDNSGGAFFPVSYGDYFCNPVYETPVQHVDSYGTLGLPNPGKLVVSGTPVNRFCGLMTSHGTMNFAWKEGSSFKANTMTIEGDLLWGDGGITVFGSTISTENCITMINKRINTQYYENYRLPFLLKSNDGSVLIFENDWKIYAQYIHSDGSIGKTVSVHTNEPVQIKQHKLISIFPNPTNGQIILEYELEDAMNANILIFDVRGRVVFEEKLGTSRAARNMVSVNLKNSYQHASGIYFVQIVTNEGVISNILKFCLIQ